MTAKSNTGQSVAKVMTVEDATTGYTENEDVETLFDSNLSNVPMVYTVEFSLQPGVYIIEAKSGDETKIVKIRI